MMTVMQWLAALRSSWAASAQPSLRTQEVNRLRARRYWFQLRVPLPSQSAVEAPRRTLPQAQDTRDNRRSYPLRFPITGGCR